jgi:hypothetical protein
MENIDGVAWEHLSMSPFYRAGVLLNALNRRVFERREG